MVNKPARKPAFSSVMNQEIKIQTSSQLKQAARGLLLGKYGPAISVLVTTQLLLSVLTLITRINGMLNSPASILINYAISFIINLFGGILSVGVSAFYLNIVCGKPYRLSDIFIGFKNNPDKAIGIRFFTLILSTLPMLPAHLLLLALTTPFPVDLGFRASSPESLINLALIMLLLAIGGYAVSLWVLTIYGQAFRLLLDFPERSVLQLLKMSRELTRGHRLRLYYIFFSFTPLYLAGIISFGIGLLFVIPYVTMTNTLFYLDLLNYKTAQNQHN